MNRLFKLSSFFVFFVFAIVFFLFFDASKISTNIFDLFPNVEQRELLDIHSSLENSNKLLIYTKQDIKNLESIYGVDNILKLKDNIYVININKNIDLNIFYSDFKSKIESYSDIKYFSQDILNIENSSAIFNDVNFIMLTSISFLILLYLFILRIPFLSLNSIFTIISANLLAMLTITLIFDNVNIMALNFGIAIGNLAIDYMLHHHFFGIYTKNKFTFNTSVFYGFITTFIGFFICLFVPFPLLSQLSLYALICLFVSYISFGILYQFIGFKQPIFYNKLASFRINLLDSKIIFFISIVALVFGLINLKFDYNLERLDYENIARLNDKDFFEKNLDKYPTILIKADSIESLDSKVEEIIGLVKLRSDIRNLKIVEHDSKFYTKLDITNDSIDNIKDFSYIDTRTIKQLGNEITNGIYKPMAIIIFSLILLMIAIIFFITRSLISLCFIITPLSVVSLYFLTTQVNIMHLFSILIIIISSIDYGIYVNKEGENIKTIHSIIFSVLTTIAGFGFLSFSNILALKSFGIVVALGVSTILILLIFQKRYN